MDKKEFFDSFSNMEAQLGQLYQQLGEVKKYLVELIEENHALKLENQHLRRHMEGINDSDSLEASEKKDKKNRYEKFAEIGEGYDNLARLYQEGFHICNVHFGSPRKDEDCLFCLSFLNKK